MLRRKNTHKLVKSLLLIISVALLVASPVINVFISSQPASAATPTLATSTNIKDWITAYRYYYAIQYCAQNQYVQGTGGYTGTSSYGYFKQSISGNDITGANRDGGYSGWFIDQPKVEIGTLADQWGDKNGETYCFGEDKPSSPENSWFSYALTMFGFDMANPKNALTQLGYSCNNKNGTIDCTNTKTTADAKTQGSILNKVANSPYLSGVDMSTNSMMYKAASYSAALSILTSSTECAAGPNATSNVTNVKTVGSDGQITDSQWGYPSDKNIFDTGAADLSYADQSGSGKCSDLVRVVNNDAGSWVDWLASGICTANYKDLSGGVVTINSPLDWACINGWKNSDNITYCLSAYQADANRNLCFKGQGLPQDSSGKTAGDLCLLSYKDTSTFSACVKGAINKSDKNYCNANYQLTPTNTQASIASGLLGACNDGAALNVGGGGKIQPSTTSGIFDPSGGGSDTSATTCAVPSIGWIVCPIITGMANISDGSFNFLSDSFLQINTKEVETGGPTYTAWSYMRNLANIVFVIVFVVIIFSQLTGIGITNYGVKKMLPRLVIAAVLVNLSFFICQIAVDLSNILGYGLKSLFDLVATNANVNASYGTLGVNTGSGLWSTLGNSVLAAGAAAGGIALLWVNLAALVPVLFAGLIALLMAFIMLIMRQMLIILFVVISPLAFVAFILPNTKKLFDQWRKMFTSLLLLFPIVGVIYGASTLASSVLKASAGDQPSILTSIMAAALMTLPLFIIPGFLKKSLNGINGLGAAMGRINGKVQGASKAGAKSVFDNSRLGQFKKYRSGQWARNRSLAQSGSYAGRNPLRKLQSSANRGINNSGVLGQFGVKSAAAGVALTEKLNEEEIQAQAALDTSRQMTASDHLDRIEGGTASETEMIASVRAIGKIGGVGDVMRLARASSMDHLRGDPGSTGAKVRQEMQGIVASKSDGDPAIGGGSIPSIGSGTYDQTARHIAFAESADLTAERFLSMQDAGRTALLNAVGTTEEGSASRQAMERIQKQISSDQRLGARAGRDVQSQIGYVLGNGPSVGVRTATADGKPIRDAADRGLATDFNIQLQEQRRSSAAEGASEQNTPPNPGNESGNTNTEGGGAS